jgi:hypothetical protein
MYNGRLNYMFLFWREQEEIKRERLGKRGETDNSSGRF